MMRSEFQRPLTGGWRTTLRRQVRVGEQAGAHGHVPVKADRAFTWGDGDED